MNAEKHLMIFHVGPVQEFILTARRSRDLWFGSWLLSELSKSVALEIAQRNNGIECLIFPAPQNLDELHSKNFQSPNKVIAVVGQQPEELAKAVREVLLKRLRGIREDAFQEIGKNFDRVTADCQVDDLPEFYWVACPVNENYGQALKCAEALMATRKATRDFMPVSWGSQVPKSSLDGQRESVIPQGAYTLKEEELRKRYGVRPGEQLCGVGLLKRRGGRKEGDSFLSTSHIAALPLLNKLINQAATDKYFNELKSLGISSDVFGTSRGDHPVFGNNDGQLLYEDRLKDFVSEKDLEQAKKALRSFLKQALDGKKPIPYYALLQADGDNIGKIIDQYSKTDAEHRKFSKQLSCFAAKVGDIVEKHEGSLVYSGGDDVLAFVPLHTVLACARCLADEFYKRLTDFKVKVNEGEKDVSPTLSVGIAVVHHLEPLSDALVLVRQAEKTAKAITGKNALAVTVSKRSGVDRTVKGRWDEKFYQRLTYLIRLHRQDAISGSAAYELRELALQLKVPDKVTEETKENFQEIARIEAVRILQRKKAQQGHQPIADADLQKLKEYTEQLSIEQLAEELIIARLFAEAMDQAGEVL